MGDIKSAREIAMEKLAQIGEPTEEERLEWRYVPEGEKLAARFLRENANLSAGLQKYGETEREYVSRGAVNILARNIALPRNDNVGKISKAAMDGIKTLKKDKVGVENVYSKIRRLFDHYSQNGEQQKREAYQSLKAEFTDRFQRAMQQQVGIAQNYKIDVERQPQFQEEWMRLQNQLDGQYIKVLEEYKQELVGLG
jgi:hypothetical protein